MAAEALPQARDDRAGRADGQLLPDHLEDERTEGIERGRRVQPRPRMEVRRASINSPRIGSAWRRNSRAVGSATAEPPVRARPAGESSVIPAAALRQHDLDDLGPVDGPATVNQCRDPEIAEKRVVLDPPNGSLQSLG
jgi:hypothetical protein